MQAVGQVAAHFLVQAAQRDQGSNALCRAGDLQVRRQRQAAHAVHQREDAGLLQIELLFAAVAARQQSVPPAAAFREGIHRGSKAAQHGVVVGNQLEQAVAHAFQQLRVATDRMRVYKDRQGHQAFGRRQDQPFAHLLGKTAGAAAPFRVAEHDVARARRVAELAERVRKTLADCLQVGRWLVAVTQDQAVVLVGLEQLFAAALAAHHEQAAVLDQFARRQHGPGALEQLGVQFLHQGGDHADLGAAALQQLD